MQHDQKIAAGLDDVALVDTLNLIVGDAFLAARPGHRYGFHYIG